MESHFIRVALVALGVTACAAPAKVDKPRDQMSERERDSTIAISGLPGSGVVKRAMAVSDGEAKHAAVQESASDGN
jgi:hypothetical protein